MAVTTYITREKLAIYPGVVELAQLTANDGEAMVLPELLLALIRNESTDEFSSEDIALGQSALNRIDDAINDAQSIIDGYLRQRGHRLPLVVIPRQLEVWARDITRYQLHRNPLADERNDPILRNYKMALEFLERVATGKYSLGIEDKEPVQGGAPQHIGSSRTFDMGQLKDYGK